MEENEEENIKDIYIKFFNRMQLRCNYDITLISK